MPTKKTNATYTLVHSPGAELAVTVEGNFDDAIILLHGGPGVPDYLADVARLLAAEHRVICYDQRGSGKSRSLNDSFELDDHIADLEAIRVWLGAETVALFGHSWGGTLAQLYAQHFPQRVSHLFLSNAGIGLGQDWADMEREVMAYNRRQAGLMGFTKLGLFQLLSMLPGSMGDRGAQRMMAIVWRNYFDLPAAAPPPDPTWLAGVKSRPVWETRKAALAADAAGLNQIQLPLDTRVLILFGGRDIYGPTTARLFERYPQARRVVLESSGHLPWLQSPTDFKQELLGFFQRGQA